MSSSTATKSPTVEFHLSMKNIRTSNPTILFTQVSGMFSDKLTNLGPLHNAPNEIDTAWLGWYVNEVMKLICMEHSRVKLANT